MKEILLEYQQKAGWSDQSIISILCDYIDAIQRGEVFFDDPDYGLFREEAHTDSNVLRSDLREYLEQRAEKEGLATTKE